MIKDVLNEHGLLSIIPNPVDAGVDVKEDGNIEINIYEPGTNLYRTKGRCLFQEKVILNHDEVCIDDFILEGQFILCEEMVKLITGDLESLLFSAMNAEADCYRLNLESYMKDWKEYFYQFATRESMKQFLKTKPDNQ